MAAITQALAGFHDDPATWAALTGSGPGGLPAAGDTVTLIDDLTVRPGTTWPIGANTATPAVQYSAAVTGKTCTVPATARIINQGDFKLANSAFSSFNSLTIHGRFTFKPANGDQCKFDCNNTTAINVIGTDENNLALVDTDLSLGGLPSYMSTDGSNRVQGLRTVNYAEFRDFGDSSHWGLSSWNGLGPPHTPSALGILSFDNFLLTRCTIQSLFFSTWESDVTFRGSIPTSDGIASSGGVVCCAKFGFDMAGSTATWLIDTAGFVLPVDFVNFKARLQVTNSKMFPVLGGTSAWTDPDHFKGNYLETNLTSFYGPLKNNYVVQDVEISNAHAANMQGASGNCTGCVFEAGALSGVQSDVGDALLYIGNAVIGATTISGNVVLMSNLAGYSSGVIDTMSPSGVFTIEHNTLASEIQHSHNAKDPAGSIAYIRSNLFYNGGLKLLDADHQGSGDAGTEDVVDPTHADYNASVGGTLTTPYPGSYAFSGNGYVSNFTALPGTHDTPLPAGDYFVASTRNRATWDAMLGGAGTISGAKARIEADPSLIMQPNTGLYEWVRNGRKVTSSALNGTAHDLGVVGAMGYQAASSGRTGMDNRKMRPY